MPWALWDRSHGGCGGRPPNLEWPSICLAIPLEGSLRSQAPAPVAPSAEMGVVSKAGSAAGFVVGLVPAVACFVVLNLGGDSLEIVRPDQGDQVEQELIIGAWSPILGGIGICRL